MDNPTRLQQLMFGLTLIGFGLLSALFVLAPSKARGEYRTMVADIFKITADNYKEV